MLLLMATTPVTLYECERSFKRLRIIKTYLLLTMSEDRLNRLSLYIDIKTYISIVIILFPNLKYVIQKECN